MLILYSALCNVQLKNRRRVKTFFEIFRNPSTGGTFLFRAFSLGFRWDCFILASQKKSWSHKKAGPSFEIEMCALLVPLDPLHPAPPVLVAGWTPAHSGGVGKGQLGKCLGVTPKHFCQTDKHFSCGLSDIFGNPQTFVPDCQTFSGTLKHLWRTVKLLWMADFKLKICHSVAKHSCFLLV